MAGKDQPDLLFRPELLLPVLRTASTFETLVLLQPRNPKLIHSVTSSPSHPRLLKPFIIAFSFSLFCIHHELIFIQLQHNLIASAFAPSLSTLHSSR